jgi:hypothetical protein
MKLAFLDLVQKRGCAPFDDPNVDFFVRAQITTQHGRDDALHRHGRGAYRESPATTFAERLSARHERLGFGEHVAAVHEQALAFARQAQTTASAVEKPDSERRFQLAYTARQCRLREVHFSRGARHATRVVDSHERAQLPEIRIEGHG